MRDSFGGDFSVTAVVAFAIGGVAALLLAGALALGGYGRPERVASKIAAGFAPTPSASSSAQPEAEIEYLLDTAEPANSSR